MDICLLCLELKHESGEFIKVDSIKLPDNESVEEVIEKYLWPMESISCNSWLCHCCWQTLYDFHKFYLRIEEAHEDLAHMLDIEPLSNKGVTADSTEINQMSANDTLEKILYNQIEGSELVIPNLNEQRDQEQMEIIQEIVLNLESQNTMEPSIQNDIELLQNLQETEKNVQESTQNLTVEPIKVNHLSVERTVEEECQKLSAIAINTVPIVDEELITQNVDGDKTETFYEDKLRDPLNKSEVSSMVSLTVPYNDINLETEIRSDISQITFNSENSNDSENSDSNSSETSLSRENYNKNLSLYNNLPNNKKDEDDRIIGQYIKLKCHICQEVLKTFHDLRCHYKSEHDQHGYHKCCEKVFRRRNLLADHIRWHMDPEYFKCSLCGKRMAERRCLELHIINKHQNREKSFECDICKKAFSDAATLRNHKLIHLPEEEKKFQCPHCKKNFGSKHLLGNHISSVHLMKYIKVCDICGKKFRVKMKFERHMLEHKGVAKTTVKCDICGFQSVDEACLRRHKYSQHPEGGKTEYQCHLCSKISPSLRAHKVHVQYNHEMSCNFKCTICDKAFKRAHCLKEHMATHTREDLYTCPYCPMKFKSNANLHKHRKNTHPVEWENDRRKKFSGILPPTPQKPSTY